MTTGVKVPQTLEMLRQENPDVPVILRDVYNARAALGRNGGRVSTGTGEAPEENSPAIYTKPHPTPDERIRADLRTELAKVRAELDERNRRITELEDKIKSQDEQIRKYENFVDICNERMMRKNMLESLAAGSSQANGAAAA